MAELKQNHKMGFGTAPLGNMFREIPEEEARRTVEAAWEHGIRYFDTAPFYGAGLAEIRLGEVLSQYNRDDFVLSTKVGRLILDEEEDKEGLFHYGRKNKVVDDYSAEATEKSLEDSMKRLQTDRLDYVYVHDISPDFQGDEWLARFDEARTGAFRVLEKKRKEGVIQGWGLGVNRTEPIETALQLEEMQPTISLQATRYNLLNHEHALQRLMPAAEKQGMDVVVGAPFGSGVLVGGDHYDYGDVPDAIARRVNRLKQIAESHDVPLNAAAIQFSAAHPAVAAVIPGGSRPERIKDNMEALQMNIPDAFWQELRRENLVSRQAPLPGGN
ncbi:aldo/keto reductase [Alkalicoccus urumqiensis]|uniref:D-threo-aldose 1-dehydrogenase n=1 Tax=Alkalicoccus urumqiensis TaxID=1548213 RepID=A0A2P6MJ76_ALKUR|nr:aldo/keto reductase [Alkalicoccus urumqiensis]PRO66339.1 D-threo-aldose 1-dehydrogenase [Alkalicoccus urumqiensis]